MRKLIFLILFFATPAFSVGLEIEVSGENVNGTINIDLLEDVAPLHVAQITALAADGVYDGVVFHRVINGFMAQTGDVKFGKDPSDMSRAGMADLILRISRLNFPTFRLIVGSLAWPVRKALILLTANFLSCLQKVTS